MTVPPKIQPLVQLVIRRTENDCALVALAVLLSKSYEDVIAAAGQAEGVKLHRKGAYATQIQRIAKGMGTDLIIKRRWTVDADGILFGDYTTDKGVVQRHAVLLRAGLIWDVDWTVWKPEDYLTRFKPMMILKRDE